MTARCKLCGETLELNEDSLETRAAGVDLNAQLRGHMKSHSMDDVYRLIVHSSHLVDRIAFEPALEYSAAWRENAIAVLDWTMVNFPAKDT